MNRLENEWADIDRLKAVASQLLPDEVVSDFVPGDDINLESVFESFSKLFVPTSVNAFGQINALPTVLPFGEELDKFYFPEASSYKKSSGFSTAVEEQFGDRTYSDYAFLRHNQFSFPEKDVFNVQQIRKDFPILHQKVNGKNIVWFDNAATTQKPLPVINRISEFYKNDNSNIHRAAHSLAERSTDAYEKSRDTVRRFINASSVEEIIFVRGTTEGINLVAQTFGRKYIGEGDEIIVSTLDHHANIVPWQQLAKERKAKLLAIPVNERGEIIFEEYERLLSPRTKMVSIGHVNNTYGTVLPVKSIIDAAKRYGAKTLIDGAQSIAHTRIDVQELDADFFVFSGHKIYAPNGIGVVYGKKHLLEVLPPWQGGGNMIKDVTFEETIFNEPPARFEAGTPNVADAVGLGAALDYVSSVGIVNIEKYEHYLTEYAREHLAQINGLRFIGSPRERVSVVSFVLQNIPTTEVSRLLDQEEGIALRSGHHCAQPALRALGVESTVRPSFAFYNTTDEIERLVDAVRRILHKH